MSDNQEKTSDRDATTATPDELARSYAAAPLATVEVIRRAAPFFRPYGWLVLGNLLCALAAIGFSLAFPRITQFIVDDVIGRNERTLLVPAVLGLLGTFLARDLFTALRFSVNSTLRLNVLRDIRCATYAHLQGLPVSWFDRRASGDLMTRLIDDTNILESALVDTIEQLVVVVLSIALVSLVLFARNPTLALLACAPIPLLAVGHLWYGASALRRYRGLRTALGALNAPLADSIQGIRQIKIYGGEAHENARFARGADVLRARALDVFKAWAVYSPSMAFIGSLGTVLVLWIGGGLVVDGRMTVGELVGFLFYLALFYQPLDGLHSLNQNLQAARAAGERVLDILGSDPERCAPRGTAGFAAPVRGEVRYEDVSFGYDGGRDIVEDVSLHALPGQTIALVGETGSGKSTVVNLLTRFYEATSGRITIDGVDIADLSLAELRAQVALVTQDAFVFNSTIRDNLLYGRRDADDDAIRAAAVAANCHDFIARMPLGYDTLVGERGVRLSGGERQRIGIARAILKDARILVLDEATASVDTVTELAIQEALKRVMKDRTSFVIAHRLGTIRGADQILVFRRGTIVERGDHDSLLALDGVYAALWRPRRAEIVA